ERLPRSRAAPPPAVRPRGCGCLPPAPVVAQWTPSERLPQRNVKHVAALEHSGHELAPIEVESPVEADRRKRDLNARPDADRRPQVGEVDVARSEERRVGKE